MKRRALCVFSLLFWLLTVSTFVSARVERLMTPTVEVQEINAPLPGTTISADALFCDETGMHTCTRPSRASAGKPGSAFMRFRPGATP